jgi:hypothetical protein
MSLRKVVLVPHIMFIECRYVCVHAHARYAYYLFQIPGVCD